MAPNPSHPCAHGLTSHATRVTQGWWALPAPASLAAPRAFRVLASRLLRPSERSEGRRPGCRPRRARPGAALAARLTRSPLQVHSPADAGLWHAHHRHPAPRHRAPLRQARDGALRPKHVSGECWLSSVSTSTPISFVTLSAQMGAGWMNAELCI